MKLAIICTEMLPSPAVRGGAIQMMIDGVIPFLTENHDVTVFSVTDPGLYEHETDGRLEYVRVPKDNYAENVSRQLRYRHFDIVHVFNRPVNLLTYKEASPDSKFVLGLHNDMLHPKKISDDLGRRTVEAVAAINTVSGYIKQTVITRFPEAEKKTEVVYSGVDLQQYPPVWTMEGEEIRNQIRKQMGLVNSKVILFIGRLSKNKGPHVLIQALGDILREHPDAVLVIAGGKWFSDNGMNKYIRSLHRQAAPLGDRVIFTKFIPANEIAGLFLAGDVFVCPSQWQEPLARVHYEAMAAGIPVVTTNRGGNGEIISHRENGWLIDDYQNPKAFANAVSELFSNSSSARLMAENGRRTVEGNFRFSHVAERLEGLYNKVLKTPEI